MNRFPRPSGLITLLTDFGERDTYVGQMKAVILSLAPQVRLVDLTHAIPPQDILEGSFQL
ncbi:MAG: SAM-dependent chlorinase/fluorinase, partial [Thermorudis peleae]|nr:SAM-dependent chlorinase/fluorinase [Thermorudis peleae]